MIVKSGDGYQVKSEAGKNLSKPGLSKGAAERRLQQVEYFKHRGLADGGLVHTNPSEGQKRAGNYQKGHLVLHGMRLSMENPAGSERSGVDPTGKPWSQRLAHDYGYIRGTTGKDKDHLDVFLGPRADDPEAMVYVIDQNKKDSEDFDEHKVMMGFDTPDEAVLGYHRNYEPGWSGFRGVTPMSMSDFKQWAYSGKSGKRKPAADYVKFAQDLAAGGKVEDCGCGGHARQNFAEGGSTGAYVGYRSPRRRERANDREAAKDVPLQALRGVLAGTAGLPGDLEALVRLVPGLARDQGLTSLVTGQKGRETVLPTTEEVLKAMPLQARPGAGKLAAQAGSLFGMIGPWIKGAQATGKGLGALGEVAEQLARRAEPAIERGVQATMDRGGLPAQLLGDLAQGTRAAAVKPKGGNWESYGIDKAVRDLSGARFGAEPTAVQAWLEKRLPAYIRNQLGTVDDPLLKLEAQGRLHLTPEDLLERADEHALWKRHDELPTAWRDPNAPPNSFADSMEHKELTGRGYRTPWEALSDTPLPYGRKVATVLSRGDLGADAAWLEKLDPESLVYSLSARDFRHLGFDHVRDYLNQATAAGEMLKNLGGREGMARAFGPHAERADGPARDVSNLVARNLHIDPDDLVKMSLSDVVSKTSDWNKLIYKAKQLEDMNKGVKSVLKQYPSGHQWVELAPEGLQAEGNAMRHCVGGYCSEVEGGSTRILSLRDKSGKPFTTVELNRNPYTDPRFQVPQEVLDQADVTARTEARRQGLRGEDLQFYMEDARQQAAEDWAKAQPVAEDTPWNVVQIKGPANRAPSADVLPMVQDFVKNMGPWGRVDDLSNTGLRQTRNSFNDTEREFLRGKGRGDLPDYLTPAEYDELQLMFPRGPFPMPEGYAAGGTVIGAPTVGLGTFASGPQGQGVQPMRGVDDQLQAQLEAQGASGQQPGQLGQNINMGLLPQPIQGGSTKGGLNSVAPIYDLSDPYGQYALSITMGAGGQGEYVPGAAAFLPKGWNFMVGGGGSPDSNSQEEGRRYAEENNAQAGAQLAALAKQLGMDTSGYDLGDTSGIWDPMALRPGDIGWNPKGLVGLRQNMDEQLKDYVRIGGLSAGWDGGQNGMRGAASTLYKREGNKLVPVSRPQYYKAPEHRGWAREEGADFLSALSMVMPAFGGWAGLLGQGAQGTLTAAGGLGLTGSLPAGLVNGAMGSLLSGNASGLLGGLGGIGGGYLGGLTGLPGGQFIGQQLGTKAGQQLGQRR